MADNYLERQMEEYEKRKAAWERAKRTKKRVTPSLASGTPQNRQPVNPTTHHDDKQA